MLALSVLQTVGGCRSSDLPSLMELPSKHSVVPQGSYECQNESVAAAISHAVNLFVDKLYRVEQKNGANSWLQPG